MARCPVSRPRSSNRTCGFPASGFPTGFTARPTATTDCARVEGIGRPIPRRRALGRTGPLLASGQPRLANVGLSVTVKRCLRSGLRCMPDGTVEIITGKERRRRWSVEEKLRIVAEAEEPGARITEVAARHEVYPSLLFNWRRQVREGRLAPRCLPQFVPVHLISSSPETAAPPPRQPTPDRARACHQLSQTTPATSWTAARKFRAVFS